MFIVHTILRQFKLTLFYDQEMFKFTSGANLGFLERGFVCIMVCVCVCVGGGGSLCNADFISFLGTDVSPFPNFNNSVSTTRRYSLLHC